MLDWPVSVVLDSFWSSGICCVSHDCGLWSRDQEKFLGDIDYDIVNIGIRNWLRLLHYAD